MLLCMQAQNHNLIDLMETGLFPPVSCDLHPSNAWPQHRGCLGADILDSVMAVIETCLLCDVPIQGA